MEPYSNETKPQSQAPNKSRLNNHETPEGTPCHPSPKMENIGSSAPPNSPAPPSAQMEINTPTVSEGSPFQESLKSKELEIANFLGAKILTRTRIKVEPVDPETKITGNAAIVLQELQGRMRTQLPLTAASILEELRGGTKKIMNLRMLRKVRMPARFRIASRMKPKPRQIPSYPSPETPHEKQIPVMDRQENPHDGEFSFNEPFGKVVIKGSCGYYGGTKAKQFTNVKTQRSGLTTGQWLWVEDPNMQGSFHFRTSEDGSVKGSWGWHESSDNGGQISGSLSSKTISTEDLRVVDAVAREHETKRVIIKSEESSDEASEELLDPNKAKAQAMLSMLSGPKKKKKSRYNADSDFHPSSSAGSEDYSSLNEMEEDPKIPFSYSKEPLPPIKTVSNRERILYYKRFCDLMRVGLVPEQIYPVMEAEKVERKLAAKSSYEQDLEAAKQETRKVCTGMWIDSNIKSDLKQEIKTASVLSATPMELVPPSPKVKTEATSAPLMEISTNGTVNPYSPETGAYEAN